MGERDRNIVEMLIQGTGIAVARLNVGTVIVQSVGDIEAKGVGQSVVWRCLVIF